MALAAATRGVRAPRPSATPHGVDRGGRLPPRRDDILGFWTGTGHACRNSRLIPTVANGRPAFGQYKPSGPGGTYEPWALQVLEVSDSRIVEFTFVLDTALFPLFGLPATPDG